jgi:hypothetical protein
MSCPGNELPRTQYWGFLPRSLELILAGQVGCRVASMSCQAVTISRAQG